MLTKEHGINALGVLAVYHLFIHYKNSFHWPRNHLFPLYQSEFFANTLFNTIEYRSLPYYPILIVPYIYFDFPPKRRYKIPWERIIFICSSVTIILGGIGIRVVSNGIRQPVFALPSNHPRATTLLDNKISNFPVFTVFSHSKTLWQSFYTRRYLKLRLAIESLPLSQKNPFLIRENIFHLVFYRLFFIKLISASILLQPVAPKWS